MLNAQKIKNSPLFFVLLKVKISQMDLEQKEKIDLLWEISSSLRKALNF
jgi:hypothetical protein